MGTNYYLRSKTPRMVYDEIHIAKRSAGWKPIFQAHEGKFGSIQELRVAVEEKAQGMSKPHHVWEGVDMMDSTAKTICQ